MTREQTEVKTRAAGRAKDARASHSRERVTLWLEALQAGDPSCREELFAAVYGELRAIAGRLLRSERAGHTLQPTALANEAYLRLVVGDGIGARGRAEFLALASRAMRNILVDHARARGRLKRGGGARRLTISDATPGGEGGAEVDLIALDEAMEKLRTLDERKAQLVELRFFGGLSADEAAAVLGVARSTAAEDWRLARAWLRRALEGER